MQRIRRQRQVLQETALRPTGLSARTERTWAAQVAALGQDAAILMLPVSLADPQALQSPATGNAYFMAGVSPAGGADEVAPA